jgi:hypothetical protein
MYGIATPLDFCAFIFLYHNVQLNIYVQIIYIILQL